MIRTFASKTVRDIYDGENSRFARKIPSELHDKIRRLLDQLNAVERVETLRIPPNNRLKKLSGKLKEFWSLRINDQWRIIFRWEDGNSFEVDIIDYH